MKKNKMEFLRNLFFTAVVFFVALNVSAVQARTNVTDWYIKDFDSKILVNTNSTLDITETIVADCGNLPDKHGIFRILPKELMIGSEKVKTPVTLKSITDQNGKNYNYSTISNNNGTVTWKIGDANVTMRGTNTYVIHYSVGNTIRFSNLNFDELYWNLNGNFWDIETDRFHASITFPGSINKDNTEISFYTGALGSRATDLATFKWSSPNVLEFESVKTLRARQGITASVTFPKNIITPYQPTFQEKYFEYLYLLIPFSVFIICFALWKQYGDDPKWNKTVIAEYEIPGNLSPIEMGTLMKNGGFDPKLITAEIIWFATKGLVSIREIESKILFFTSKDYELTQKHIPEVEKDLNGAQQRILLGIFQSAGTVALSSLKNKFYTNIKDIRSLAKNNLKANGLIQTTGIGIGTVMKAISPFLLWGAFASMGVSMFLALGVLLSALILLFFGFFMPKRTLAGTELNWKIQGFKLFMETVDKDRAAFYEKENIFEKFLPYAILFGMTKEWISRMRDIYGADFYATHAPIWYAGSMGSFDSDSFSSNLNNLSSAISSNTSAPSGSGGAGGSGGGGGGGGGGGW